MAKSPRKRAISVPRVSRPIFSTLPEGEDSWIGLLRKAEIPDTEKSGQGQMTGQKLHPFNMGAVVDFLGSNPHHQRAVEVKTQATVGLGWESERVAEVLDPLCRTTWQDIVLPFAESRFNLGNAYLEVVRRPNGEIGGIYQAFAKEVHVFAEGDGLNFHYEVFTDEDGTTRKFARFGDLERLKSVHTLASDSELIVWKRPNSVSRWYGYPDWLSAVGGIELVMEAMQFNADFFANGAVAEFILLLTGADVDDDDWKAIVEGIQGTVGPGGRHRTFAANIPQELHITIEKIAQDLKDGWFQGLMDQMAAFICTAHGVPPQIGGIQTPGKLGASNEIGSALKLFQALTIGPAQRSLASVLGCTLGNPELNGGLGLGPDDFLPLNILDEVDIDEKETPAAPGQAADPDAEGQEPEPVEKMDPEEQALYDARLIGAVVEDVMARTRRRRGES